VHEVREGLHAVDLDDRNPLAVTPLEIRVTRDVYLLERELDIAAYTFDGAERGLAEVAAGCVVDPDGMRHRTTRKGMRCTVAGSLPSEASVGHARSVST